MDLIRLQRVQNRAARLVTRTKTQDHITPVLHDLHWLPVIVHGPDMNPPPLGIFEDSDFWTPCYMAIQYLLV